MTLSMIQSTSNPNNGWDDVGKLRAIPPERDQSSVVMLNQAKDSWSRAGAAVKLLISQSQDYKWRKLQRSKMAAVVNKVMAETSAEKQQVAEQQQAVDDSIDREMEHEEEQVAGGQSREDGTGMEGQLEDLTEQWHLDTFFDSTGDTDSAKN